VSPYERRNIKLSSGPSKSGAPGESDAYLKLEKPRFLFIEGSGGAATTLVAAPAALTGAPSARAAPSTDRPAASGDGGGGFHLSTGARPRRSPLPPPPTINSPESPGGEPLLLAQPEVLTFLLPVLPPPDPPLLPAHHLFLFVPLRGAGGHPGPGRRWVRSCGVHGHPPLKENYQDRAGASRENEERRKAYSPPGCWGV
jgi:hypothetical protein